MDQSPFSGLDGIIKGGPYDVILMDPPWNYTSDPKRWASAAKHYTLVPTHTLALLPIPSLLNTPGIVFCWTTSLFLRDALQLCDNWGLHYRGIQFVWVKTSKVTGEPIGARGIKPSIVKPLTEVVLAFSNRKSGRPLPLSNESIRQTVLAPVREHSRKPDAVHYRLELMYPTARKLEMFSREPKPEWVTWGNETTKFSEDQV